MRTRRGNKVSTLKRKQRMKDPTGKTRAKKLFGGNTKRVRAKLRQK